MTENQFFEDLLNFVIVVVPAASSDKELAVSADELSKAAVSPPVIDISEITNEKAKNALLLKLKYIRHMYRVGITRGQLELLKDEIPRAAAELNDPTPPAFSTLSRWMREYFESHEDPFAILDRRALPIPRKRRSPEHDKLIHDILEELYICSDPKGFSDIYDRYKLCLKTHNQSLITNHQPIEALISERTLYRIIDSLDKYKVAVAHFGYAEAKRKFRFIKGHLPASYPLEYVEIDHALLDLFVIDDRLFIPLGRPWLTVIRDRHSGAVIGLFISFAGPGVDSIFSALRHSIYPHANAIAIWPDIETEMPWGLGTTYVTDRGADFLSIRYKLAIVQLGSDYEYCAVRTPWFKGPVERFFKTLSNLLETLPGRTFPNLAQRKDYDPAKHCVVRFSSFVWILYKWACDIYNNQAPRRKQASPLQLFNDGIEKVPRVFPRDPGVVETLLGHRYTGALRHDGITRDYLSYANSPQLEEIFKSRGGHSGVIVYHRNNSDLGSIRVMDPRTSEFFSVPCLSPEYAGGLTLLQHKQIRLAARLQYGNDKDVDFLSRSKLAIQHQIEEELDRKNSSPKKNLARYVGINSEQVIRGEPATLLKSTLTPPCGKDEHSESTSPLIVPVTDAKSFGWSVL
jgi:putative transposase